MERKERTLLIALLANLLLILLRFFLANLSGSIGLTANAWHSFTDVFVSTVVLVGIFVARLSKAHFIRVYEKFENALAIFVSLFIFYMGFEVLSDALNSESVELRYVPFTSAGAFLGIVINYFMARYKIYVGEETDSQSLIADGYHSKMDMYCSIAVLIGILGSLAGMNSLDKISALVAMVFLFISGYEIFAENARALFSRNKVFSHHGHSHCSCGHDHGHVAFSAGNKKMAGGLLLILAVAYLLSGIYVVKWDEVGVVRRLGALRNGEAGPGIHYRLPYPFDEVTLVKKENVRSVSIGDGGVPVQELLTGDTNLLRVNMTVHYKVTDAVKFALNVNELERLINAAAVTSIRQIVGSEGIDSLLTSGRAEVQASSKMSLQKLLDANGAGVSVVGVQLLAVIPPNEVMPSFQDLASARQDKAVYVNEARAYSNMLLPRARAEAYKTLKTAEGYKGEKIKTAEGDAALFTEKLSAYLDSKEVTEFRLYMEAMDKALPSAQKILLGGNVKISNTDLWINNGDNGGSK
jgi:membrane protease subunit HflK